MTSIAITTVSGLAAGGRGRPVVVGIGGTLRPYSSSELALRCALRACEAAGADTAICTARELQLPMYDPAGQELPEQAVRFLDAMRRADAVIVSTPGYHGGLSGLIKNALDYLQELASEPRPYLHDMAVGCIVTAAGWQSGVTTLTSLRSTVHALRGWPSPLGVVINSATPQFDRSGAATDQKVANQLAALAAQVTIFAGKCST
jgi:FMN reductase